MRIDWHALVERLVRHYGSSSLLAEQMVNDGVNTDDSTIRGMINRTQYSGANRDRAVWIYLRAQELGIEIPSRPKVGDLRYDEATGWEKSSIGS